MPPLKVGVYVEYPLGHPASLRMASVGSAWAVVCLAYQLWPRSAISIPRRKTWVEREINRCSRDGGASMVTDHREPPGSNGQEPPGRRSTALAGCRRARKGKSAVTL